jgi:SAM-dependent methyltransferase
MSFQALREFVDRHSASAFALAALGAAIDAKLSGTPLDPAIEARVDELLGALGIAGALADVSPAEAMPLMWEVRHTLPLDSRLLYPETRGRGWRPTEPAILEATGVFGMLHARAISGMIVPALGLAERFGAAGGAFLDIGVGVGGLAVEIARLWPALRVVGIDVWQPSLALARKAVEEAELGARVELREQGGEHLEDEEAFDLAWIPLPFIPERVVPPMCERTLRALRPGGWAVLASASGEAKDELTRAIWRLRVTMWGGGIYGAGRAEELLRAGGFAEVRALPGPPGGVVSFVAGRKAE